jgi:hypothetical protein
VRMGGGGTGSGSCPVTDFVNFAELKNALRFVDCGLLYSLVGGYQHFGGTYHLQLHPILL